MARVKVQGLGTFEDRISRAVSEVSRINRGALGEAAGRVADEIVGALEGMHVHREGYTVDGFRRTGATAEEKSQIIANCGIARFRSTADGYSTSIGFTGYVHTKSDRFGDMVPTGYLMQAIEYGSEFRHPTHTVSKAISRVRGEVPNIVNDYIQKEIEKVLG